MTAPLVLISGKEVIDFVGGHPSYVRAHALAARRLGFEPHIICSSRRSGSERTDYGIVHRVAWSARREPPAAIQVPVLARAAAQLVSDRAGFGVAQLIHGFGIWSAAAVGASRLLARRGLGATAVASAYATRAFEVGVMQDGLRAHHGIVQRLRHRAWLRWVTTVDDRLEGWGYAGARAVIVNYESVRRILTRAYGPGLTVRVLPYASEHAFSEPSTGLASATEALVSLEPVDAPLVLAISRHDARKGVDLLLLALGELRAAGVPFRACLIGPGRLLEQHRRLAARLGLGNSVAIPGTVPDVRPYIERADVFVLPSLGEASGSVSVLEALRAGIPVVASACDGIPEDLTDGRDALLVAPGDVPALTGALRRMLGDGALRIRLGAAGRETHEQRFSAEGFTAALGDLYAELGATPGIASTLARTAPAT